jgi:hypothetical protein
MTKKIIFKKGQEVMLNTLMNNCAFHKVFTDCNCNNGYNCLHPKNKEGNTYNCKNGCKGCFGFACPIAYQKNSEKDDKECNWGDETVMILNETIYEN